ncbi:MAG TPA: prenyltransferase/squalene oxidase repeat-containing protein [Bryobacteraceae bacterium]|nr:prenyltransferase/squalene oxidase repeat-containing protein [Bryobacteraceae bacterium]
MHSIGVTRRELLPAVLATRLAAAAEPGAGVIRYLESLRRPDGAYGWAVDPASHLTPTFAVVACYHLLEREAPAKATVARFIREHYPMMPARHKDRPLRRFDYEQIQALKWLGEDVSGWTDEVRGWDRPSIYTKAYEHEGYPVFQHEVMALLCRALVGLEPATQQWHSYVLSRRRPNGSFNSTPASDGGDGHVMNTWWGLQALKALSEPAGVTEKLPAWIRACQLPNGGFTYQPEPEIAGVDDVAYTWAALNCLEALDAKPAQPDRCAAYLHSLRNADGGYGDRPGRQSNPTATFYALDALRKLGVKPRDAARRPPARRSLPSRLKLFTIQIEAPGAGSPAEAVELALALKIHIWGAKNAQPGWIARCQEIADRRRAAVLFCVADEEYGSYQRVPGLGSPSHLADLIAPPNSDFGAPMADPAKPAPWSVFRDQRIASLRRAGGQMVWQFNENEELTRVLLDEAVETGTYGAVSSFHFGNENFLNTQPFLMRYQDVLPFVALQDAHARESWWWADQLAGFRTVFLAREPSWQGWVEALRENRVMAIRHDAVCGFATHVAGGTAEVRRRVLDAESEWRWWGKPDEILRPHVSLVALRPGDPFEAGTPESGVALRVRLRHGNTTMGFPKEPQAELLRLAVDGVDVMPRLIEPKNNRGVVLDRYHVHSILSPEPGRHTADARVREIAGGREIAVSVPFET